MAGQSARRERVEVSFQYSAVPVCSLYLLQTVDRQRGYVFVVRW